MSLQGSKVMHQGGQALITEEPDALIGHVRIRGGTGGQPPVLPGDVFLPVAQASDFSVFDTGSFFPQVDTCGQTTNRRL